MTLRVPLILALLLLAACSSAPDTPPESFTLAGQKAQFAPPPTTWTRTNQDIPATQELLVPQPGQDTRQIWPEAKELPGGALVRFTPPWSEGYLTVSAIKFWPDKELTEAHIRHLQTGVLKREKGQVVKQEEGRLGDSSGYRMSFSYLDKGKETRGVQVHVIHGGTYWTVVLAVPADRWGQAEPVFDHLVDTWKWE